MRVTCPSCAAQYSLESALQMDAARSALLRALKMPAPLAGLLAQYLGLFRAKGRVLAFDRADRLMAELLPMLDAAQVQRNGATRAAPLPVWQAALEEMMELRAADKLRLPLKSHGYLLEIVFAAADKVDAQVERATEQQRRSGEHRAAGDDRIERLQKLSRIRSDFELQLVDRGESIRRLHEIGYGEEALNG